MDAGYIEVALTARVSGDNVGQDCARIVRVSAGFAFAFLCASSLMGGSIEGLVTNSVTGEAIAGAKVRFIERRHSYVYSAVTDTSGAYELTGLDDGDYHGEFSKEGFADFRQGASLQDMLTGGVHLAGNSSAHMDAPLNPWGPLHGRVVDEEGKPVAGFPVQLSPRPNEARTLTEENGEFAFEQLRPGSYTIVAKPEPRTRVRDGEKVGSVPIYYPSATRLADAAKLSVAWGRSLSGIEIRLKNVPVHRIAGVVLDTHGRPAGHATVTLLGQPLTDREFLIIGGVVAPGMPFHYVTAPAREPDVASVETRVDGSFEFSVVERGEWRLPAETDEPHSNVASVFVGDKDVEHVQIRLSAPFRVDVTTEWGDAVPAKPPSMIRLISADGAPAVFDGKGQMTTLAAGFPGRYFVQPVSTPDGLYTAAAMSGGGDVLAQTIELDTGVAPLRVIVRHDAGTLRGTVENGKGATVFLIPKFAAEVMDYMSVVAGAGGTFEFRNVVPGDYRVVAFDRAAQRPPADLPELVATLATEVRVAPGTAGLPLNLRVSQWRW